MYGTVGAPSWPEDGSGRAIRVGGHGAVVRGAGPP
ncbi:hypothetical protein SsS58_00229 [Streptomyces scabiei]|uniref:Uncharacterized protein n=1 Tax=Streptomyces scabiei TaxID=1930 RepID=A0A100JHY7_STRSC|nr:hypothetical protein SsS58_00229 [Streptomyces scabiei]